MGLTAILSPHPLNWQGRAAARKRSRTYELLMGHAVFDGRDPCSGFGCMTSSPRTPAVYATVCPCKLAANKLYWQFDTSVQKIDGFCRPSFVFRVTFLERMYQVANTGEIGSKQVLEMLRGLEPTCALSLRPRRSR